MSGVRRVAPALVLLPLLALMCATATEIDVDIYSEVACDENAEVGLVMGDKLTDLANNALTSSADHCDPSTRVGRVVIAPSGEDDGAIAFAIVTRNDGQGLDTCTEANGYKGCIVAKRQLRFEPRTSLDIRVDLRLSCLDKPCTVDQTCVKGTCVSATCPTGGCADEKVLFSGPAAADGAAAPPGCAPTPATKLAPTVIVGDAGATAQNIPTGLAQHHHLVYAENAGQYYYFWIDNASNVIRTRASCDLATWTDGPSFQLTGLPGSNAANFDIAYLNANKTDIFHVVLDQTQGTTGYTLDLRYKLANGQLTGPTTTQIQPQDEGAAQFSDCFLTDAPSIAIGNDGTVYIASGWEVDKAGTRGGTECDMDIYQSAGHETGIDSDWTTASYRIVGYHNTQVFSTNHLLVRTPTGKIFGAFNEPESNGAPSPTYESVAWLTQIDDWDGSKQGAYESKYPTGSIFNDTKGNQGGDDWSICMLSDTQGYALRHLDSGGFEAEQWNGTLWQADTAPASPAVALAADATMNMVGAGITILQDGDPSHGMIAFTIDSKGNDDIVWSARSGAGWSKWTAIPGLFNNQVRRWVSGTGCNAKGPPVLIWTDLTNPEAAVIDMMDVSSLFKSP